MIRQKSRFSRSFIKNVISLINLYIFIHYCSKAHEHKKKKKENQERPGAALALQKSLAATFKGPSEPPTLKGTKLGKKKLTARARRGCSIRSLAEIRGRQTGLLYAYKLTTEGMVMETPPFSLFLYPRVPLIIP